MCADLFIEPHPNTPRLFEIDTTHIAFPAKTDLHTSRDLSYTSNIHEIDKLQVNTAHHHSLAQHGVFILPRYPHVSRQISTKVIMEIGH